MARGPKQDYGPEIHASVREPTPRKDKRANAPKRDTPEDMARDKQRGIVEGSPQDEAIDAKLPQQPPAPPGQGGIHPHHVTAASGIAHAILQSGKGG